MEFIHWDESLSVGVPAMDDEHKILIGIINRLYNNVEIEKNPKMFWNEITALIDYCLYHFSDEEELLRSVNYVGLAEQCKAHEAFKENIVNYRDRFCAGEEVEVTEVFQFLKQWWEKHIRNQDKAYGIGLSDLTN